jgi:hypothetical protein
MRAIIILHLSKK